MTRGHRLKDTRNKVTHVAIKEGYSHRLDGYLQYKNVKMTLVCLRD